MIQHRQVYLDKVVVDVFEARNDSIHSVQITVLGEPAFTRKPFKAYSDPQLEAMGYKKLALVNGSLFFNEATSTYANGIELVTISNARI